MTEGNTPLWNLQEWRDEADEWRGSKIGEFEAEVLADDFDACFRDGVIAGKAECAEEIKRLREDIHRLCPAFQGVRSGLMSFGCMEGMLYDGDGKALGACEWKGHVVAGHT